jgi:hypothetical protein
MYTNRIVKEAIDFLKHNQQADGAVCESAYPVFNVWETIQSLNATLLWTRHGQFYIEPRFYTRGLAFLKSAEKSSGLVLHNNRAEYQDLFCVETSAEYIRLLLRLSPQMKPDMAAKLQVIQALQMPTGYWHVASPEVPPELQAFPSVTAFAMRALAYGDYRSKYDSLALDFLMQSQKDEGHWGVEWQYYGTPFYPMEPILNVLAQRNQQGRYDRALQKAKKYLLNSQHNDGRWYYPLGGFRSHLSAETQTALALQCCFACGLTPGDAAVVKGMKWLLSRQEIDGSWNGGEFPIPNARNKCKREEVYATSLTLIALYRYEQLRRDNSRAMKHYYAIGKTRPLYSNAALL